MTDEVNRSIHGLPQVDDRRVISGIVFVIRKGLRRRDAPKDYGPHKTIYNRFVALESSGLVNYIFAAQRQGRDARPVDDRRDASEGAPDGRQPFKKAIM